MSHTALSTVDCQVRRARRRLFFQALVTRLVWCGAGALLLTAAWFVLQRLLWPQAADWWQWAIPTSLVTAASMVAVVLSLKRSPSLVTAALALDERFALKERVTTFLTLSPQQSTTAVGLALQADTQGQVENLNVAEQFPVRLAWTTALMPVCSAVLAVVAFFLAPQIGPGGNRPDPTEAEKQALAKELQDQLDKLKKDPQRKVGEELPKSEQLKEIEAAWEKLVQKPVDPTNQEQIRERIQEMRTLEEKMKDRINDLKGLADKNKDVKKALDKLATMNAKAKNNPKDGPAKELRDALEKGQFDKAKDEIDRLSKKLQEEKLSKEEKEKLAQQLQDMHDKLQRLLDQQDLKDQLKRDFDLGKISKEELDRELEKLAQEIENLEDLKDLADLLKDCKDCLGDGAMAAKKLKLIRGKLEKMELDEEELKELLRDQDLLEEIRIACLRCMNGRQTSQLPGTLRPEAPDDPNLKAKNERQKVPVDPTGQLRVSGFSRGGNFSKVPSREVGGAFRQAVQDAPEAIERQRIPADAADMAKGYFNKLGGQKN